MAKQPEQDGFGFGEGPAPVEPSADMLTTAHIFRQQYVAFVLAGFTDEQALAMVRTGWSQLMRGATDG